MRLEEIKFSRDIYLDNRKKIPPEMPPDVLSRIPVGIVPKISLGISTDIALENTKSTTDIALENTKGILFGSTSGIGDGIPPKIPSRILVVIPQGFPVQKI